MSLSVIPNNYFEWQDGTRVIYAWWYDLEGETAHRFRTLGSEADAGD